MAGHDVVQVRFLEAIKGGRCCHSVSPHVLKDQPITNLQIWQTTQLNDAVEAIARWSPDTTRIPDLLWLSFLFENGEVHINH